MNILANVNDTTGISNGKYLIITLGLDLHGNLIRTPRPVPVTRADGRDYAYICVFPSEKGCLLDAWLGTLISELRTV